jgi:hypothetical protein
LGVNLPGVLGSTTLGDLLGRLYRGGVNGVLELVEREGHAAGRAHRIHFDRGLIDEVETELSVPRLGEVLVRLGAVSGEALGRARPRLGDGRSRIGEKLVAERLVTKTAVRYALHSQLELRLDALFQLKDALIRFHVRRARRNDPDGPEPLSAREFLNGRPRKRGANATGTRPVLSAADRAALRVLGIAPGASLAEVRQAFRIKASEVHPDRHPQASPAARAELLRRFSELSRAYHRLVGT